MAERRVLLEYIPRDTVMHRLSGVTKLIMLLAASVTAMISFDTRLLIAIAALSLLGMALARIRWREVSVVVVLLLVFMALNNLLIFLFAPEYGVDVYGTRHDIAQLGTWTTLTWEQLLYQANVSLKYAAVVPIALVFIVTTSPSEFASSLNRIGVPARAAYAVSLALRFIPDFQRDLSTIANAQQARGLELGRGVKVGERARRALGVTMPLLLTSLARIETVSTALELRGFDRAKHRTWYRARPLRAADWALIALSAVSVVVAVVLLQVNGGRFYNPLM